MTSKYKLLIDIYACLTVVLNLHLKVDIVSLEEVMSTTLKLNWLEMCRLGKSRKVKQDREVSGQTQAAHLGESFQIEDLTLNHAVLMDSSSSVNNE